MPILGVIDSGKSGHLAQPGNYYSIATFNLSSNTTSITFSSILSIYSHLQIRSLSAGNQNTSVGITFNGDNSSNNYSLHALKAGEGYGTSVYSDGAANINNGVLFDQQLGNSTYYNATVADILDYSNTNKYKTMRSFSGVNSNGNDFIYLYSSVWRNTAAITSITIQPAGSGYFIGNSSFALYGVK
jgi:hypothetical protein